jgi:prefoldin subunit 5
MLCNDFIKNELVWSRKAIINSNKTIEILQNRISSIEKCFNKLENRISSIEECFNKLENKLDNKLKQENQNSLANLQNEINYRYKCKIEELLYNINMINNHINMIDEQINILKNNDLDNKINIIQKQVLSNSETLCTHSNYLDYLIKYEQKKLWREQCQDLYKDD